MTNPKPTRLSRLRELNERRTQDHPWKYDEDGAMIWSMDIKEQYSSHICDIRGFGAGLPQDTNGQFIALSANLMSDLLDVVDAAIAIEPYQPQSYGIGLETTYSAKAQRLRAALSKLEHR